MNIMMTDHNCLMTGWATKAIEKGHRLVNNSTDADIFIFWQDVMGMEKDVTMLANRTKPVMVIQHGFNAHKDYFPPNDFPCNADVYCCWGEEDKKKLESTGKFKRIEVIGSPFLEYMQIRKEKRDDWNILFSPAHWMNFIKENKYAYDMMVRKVPFDNMFVKVMYSFKDDCFKPNKNVHIIRTDTCSLAHYKKLSDLLSVSDVMVSLTEGTNEFMAHCFGVPVVCPFKIPPQMFIHGNKEEMKYSYAMDCCNDIDEFIDEMKAREFCWDEDNAKDYAVSYGNIGGSASDRIIKIAEDLVG